MSKTKRKRITGIVFLTTKFKIVGKIDCRLLLPKLAIQLDRALTVVNTNVYLTI